MARLDPWLTRKWRERIRLTQFNDISMWCECGTVRKNTVPLEVALLGAFFSLSLGNTGKEYQGMRRDLEAAIGKGVKPEDFRNEMELLDV